MALAIMTLPGGNLMKSVSRRRLLGYSTLLGVGIGTGLPGLSLLGSSPTHAAALLPSGNWLLSRLIERQLSDGNFISIARSWGVQFRASATGIEAIGNQLSVEVKAPDQLAELARLEEQRVSSLLPIAMNSRGMIYSAGDAETDEDLAKAVVLAKQIMAQAGASDAKQDQARQFMSQLQGAAQPVLESLPPDLFFPSGKKVEKTEAVPLPDGTYGQFRLEYLGTPQADTSLLDTAQRIITTTIGQSSRISRETWSLKPLQ